MSDLFYTLERYRGGHETKQYHRSLLEALLYLRDRTYGRSTREQERNVVGRQDRKTGQMTEIWVYVDGQRPGPGEIAGAVKAEAW